MPVTPTYPGIYIEEILSNSHTITAAPTAARWAMDALRVRMA